MIFPFSHDAMKPGKQYALAVVDHALPISRCPIAVGHAFDALRLEGDAHSAGQVQTIKRCIDVAKVGYSIISTIMVDVVNHIRLFAVDKEPSKSVRMIIDSIYFNAHISRAVNAARGLAYPRFMVRPSAYENARIGIVIKDISNRVRDNLCSHAELPLSVVRGLVTAITSTPILPRNAHKLNMGALNG